MQEKRKILLLIGLLVVLAIVLTVTMRGGKTAKPPPSTSGYYTGPMRNKSDPTKYTTEDGRVVAPPPGASNAPSWTPVQVDAKTGRIKESE